jgi:hypothetical protein
MPAVRRPKVRGRIGKPRRFVEVKRPNGTDDMFAHAQRGIIDLWMLLEKDCNHNEAMFVGGLSQAQYPRAAGALTGCITQINQRSMCGPPIREAHRYAVILCCASAALTGQCPHLLPL